MGTPGMFYLSGTINRIGGHGSCLAADGATFEESIQRALAVLHEPPAFDVRDGVSAHATPDAECVFGHADIGSSFGRGKQWIGGLVLKDWCECGFCVHDIPSYSAGNVQLQGEF